MVKDSVMKINNVSLAIPSCFSYCSPLSEENASQKPQSKPEPISQSVYADFSWMSGIGHQEFGNCSANVSQDFVIADFPSQFWHTLISCFITVPNVHTSRLEQNINNNSNLYLQNDPPTLICLPKILQCYQKNLLFVPTPISRQGDRFLNSPLPGLIQKAKKLNNLVRQVLKIKNKNLLVMQLNAEALGSIHGTRKRKKVYNYKCSSDINLPSKTCSKTSQLSKKCKPSGEQCSQSLWEDKCITSRRHLS